MAKVLIDPGHAPGNKNKGPTTYYEYAGMWKLSNYLKVELETFGVEVALTRKENEDPTLAVRGGKAQGYDLFISEHSNAFNGKTRGCEVFYSLRRFDRDHATRLAVLSAQTMGNTNRGAKTRSYVSDNTIDYYGVIRAAASTNVSHIFLCESGFHDEKTDEAWLKNDNNLQLLAKVQAKVICEILKISNVLPDKCPKCSVLIKILNDIYTILKRNSRLFEG